MILPFLLCIVYGKQEIKILNLFKHRYFFVPGTDFLQGLDLSGNVFVFMDDKVYISCHADTLQRKDHHISVADFSGNHSFGEQRNSSAAEHSVFDGIGAGAAEESGLSGCSVLPEAVQTDYGLCFRFLCLHNPDFGALGGQWNPDGREDDLFHIP